jgi:hypothetical protein
MPPPFEERARKARRNCGQSRLDSGRGLHSRTERNGERSTPDVSSLCLEGISRLGKQCTLARHSKSVDEKFTFLNVELRVLHGLFEESDALS